MPEDVDLQILPPGLNGPQEDLGVRSLRRTRRILGARSIYLGIAIFLTTVVLALLPATHDSYVELLRRAGVAGAIVTLASAFVFWALFLKKCHELKATGLPPRRGLRARNAWGAGGFLVAFVVAELVNALSPGGLVDNFVFVAIGLGSIWLGDKLHQVETADEIRFRSATQKIFDDQDNG